MKIKVSKEINDARSCISTWLEKIEGMEQLAERYFERVNQEVEAQCDRVRKVTPHDIEVDLGLEAGVLNRKVVDMVGNLSYYEAIKQDVDKVVKTLSEESLGEIAKMTNSLNKAVA